MKTLITALSVSVSVALTASAVSVDNVFVRQQWPWSTKVNVDYVLHDAANGTHDVKVEFRNGSQVITNLTESLSGDRFGVGPGAHTLTWDPGYGGSGQLPAVIADMTATVSVPDDGRTWMVMDISGGKDAESFPITFTNAPPPGGWNQDEYKTTKIVLRRIPATTFQMGLTDAEKSHFEITGTHATWAARQRRTVTLTRDYYIGVFETTHKQNSLMFGTGNSSFPKCPARNITYATVCGSNANEPSPYGVWPNYAEGSYLAALNNKVTTQLSSALPGYKFELPSYAQWECACRGGVDTCFNSGKNWADDGTASVDSNLAAIAQYGVNVNSDPWPEVGQKLPNAFGLYDMHGGVMELIRDVMNTSTDSGVTDPQTDPLLYHTGSSSFQTWACGGSVKSVASGCLSDSVVNMDTKNQTASGATDPRWHTGYRLACVYVGE